MQIGAGGTSGSISGNVTDNATLAFNRSDNLSYGGIISGSGSLTQAGGGTLTLSGANTYSGPTTVSSGTLKLGSSQALGGGGMVILSSAQGVLDGSALGNLTLNNVLQNNGIVQAPTVAGQALKFTGDVSGAGSFTGNVAFSGSYSPGNSPAITHLENVTFDPASTLKIELGGLVAGTGYDQVQATGAAILDGSLNLSLINGFLPHVGDVFTVMTYGSHTGSFASITGLPFGNGVTLHAIYNADSLQLVAESSSGGGGDVPEPGTFWLFGAAVPWLAGAARRAGRAKKI